MADLRDFTKKNPIFVGTDGIRLPTGNSAQRVASSNVAGTMRYNTDLNGMELYSPSGWVPLAAPPSISTVSPSTYNGASGTEFTINGSGFTPDAQVYFVIANGTAILASTVSYYSAVQIRATTPRAIKVEEEPISVRVTQQSGIVTKTDCIDAGGVPNWITTAGTLGSIFGANTVNVYVSATDPEGTAITYQITSGSLPGGLNFSTANGLVQGVANSVLANTTYNFTIKANDTVNNNTDRSFSYTVLNRAPVINTAAGSLGTIYSGNAASASISAYDPDGGQLTYSVSSGTLPVNSSLGSANGVISGTPVVVTTNTTYSFTLTSTDEGSLTASNNYTYTVLNRPPKINTAAGSLGTIVSGNAISTTIDAYDPDGAAVSFAITSGNLMATANIGSSNGTITASNSLIVLANTTYTFTVRATDVGEMSVSNTYTYTVLNRPPLWNTNATLTSYSSETFTPITVNAYDPDGGSVTYSLTSGSVPTGLTFVSANATITGTPTEVTDNTTSTFTVTVTDPGSDANARTFSLTITPIIDANFANTTLLLHADADTVIKDASTSNLPITVIADSRASNFNPYNTSWSGYFDGSSSIRTVANPNLAIGTGDVTVEFWMNTFDNSDNGIFGTTDEAAWNSTSWSFIYSSGAISLYNGNVGGVFWSISTGTLHDGNWHHVAIVRSSGTWQVFVNGVSKGTTTTQGSRSLGNNTWRFAVGCIEPSNADIKFTGYISNFRLNNTALYSSNFTPSTTPLTEITGTTLLTCQSNRFVDNKTSPIAFTAGSFPQTVGFSPFAETDTSNGSMYFDGTGDYLTIPNDTAFSYNSIFSAELWYYSTHTSCTDVIPFSGNGNWDFIIPAATTVAFRWFVPGYGDTNAHTMIPSSWNHIAVAVSGGRLSFYLNGTRMYTNASVSFSLGGSDTSKIGYGSNSIMKGYISNVRVTRGSTPYDPTQATITVPTSPLTTVSGTTFLTVQNRKGHNNHALIDESKSKSLITRFGTTTQGTFTPFSADPGKWSNYFTSAGISIPYAASLQLQNTNWTIESYFNLSSASAEFCIMGASNGGGGVPKYFMGGNWNTSFGYTANRATFFTYTGGNRFIDVPFTWEIGKWYHMAAVYTHSNTTITLYINGVSVGSMAYGLDNTTGNILIGRNGENGGVINGYISNFRYIVGTSLYTSNFTPNTTPLTAITNTQILTCQSNSFVDNSASNRTVSVATGSPSVQAFSPFAPNTAYSVANTGGSIYNAAAGDGLKFLTSNHSFGINGDFTIEMWYYPTGQTGDYNLLWALTDSTSDDNPSIGFFFNSSYNLFWLNNGAGGNGFDTGAGINIVPFQWTHIVISRSGANTRCWTNGKLRTSNWGVGAINTSKRFLYVGIDRTATVTTPGYTSGFRFVNGNALYSGASDFTPPSAPFTAVANTVALINGTNAGLIDNTSRNVLRSVGDAKISTAQSKFGGSAMHMPATNGNYFISPPNQPNFLFGTGQFTVEAWVYPTAFSNQAAGIFGYGLSGGYTDWVLELDTSGNALWVDTDGVRFYASTSLSLNTWTHVAVVRTNSVVTLYYNGVSVGTYSTINNISGSSTSARLYVGTGPQVPGSRQFIGYIDELRITKGVARYTTTFTPATKAFSNR